MLSSTETELLPGRTAAVSVNPGQEDSPRCSTLTTEFVLDQEVEDFLLDCRARGLSRKTLNDGYGFPLRKRLVPWAKAVDLCAAAQLDQDTINRFSRDLLEQTPPLSAHSVNSYLRAVRQFLNWAQRRGLAGADRPQLARTRKRVVDTLSREEVQQLEDAAQSERDKLLIRILADTGMRVGELIGITTKDLLLRERNHFLRIKGKTGERLVPIRPALYQRLVVFRERTRPPRPGTEALFLTERKRPTGYAPLGIKGVQMLVAELAYRAGLDKRVHPHLFRHSYATWALQRGMQEVTLAEIMGCSIELIARTYGHLRAQDIHRALMRLFDDE